MEKRPIKYFTLVFIIGMGLVHPLISQEGGLMFRDEEQQEEVNAAGAKGSHYERQNLESDDQGERLGKHKPKTPKEPYINPVDQEQNPAEKEQNNATIENQNKKEDSDSVLSFNFLHYIIQKFKFSDVIDQ